MGHYSDAYEQEYARQRLERDLRLKAYILEMDNVINTLPMNPIYPQDKTINKHKSILLENNLELCYNLLINWAKTETPK